MDDFTFLAEHLEKIAGRGEGAGAGRPKGSKDKKPRKKKGEMSPEDYIERPHQERAINRLIKNNGRLLMTHGTGTGKTLSTVRGFKRLKDLGMGNRALVVTPAGLKDNFINEGIKKFTNMSVTDYSSQKDLKTKKPSDFNVVSYALFRRHPELFANTTQADTLITDEIHKAKNFKGSTYQSLMKVRPRMRNAILATASPVGNKPSEILPLINIVSGENLENPKSGLFRATVKYDPGSKGFLGFFRRAPSYKVREKSPYAKAIRKYTDLVTVESLGKADFPERKLDKVEAPMSEKQEDLFNYILGDISWWTKWKIKRNYKLNREEAQHVFQKIQQARALSNGIHTIDESVSLSESARQTPKVKIMIDDIKAHIKETPDAQVVIYSNLIKGGVDVIKAGLDNEGIDYGLFVGKGTLGTTEKSRNKDVEDFKKGKKKVIILSGAGAEGLSFQNATFHASMDGHYNPEVIKQSEARSRRLGGLSHRPKDERHVIVKRYLTVFPKGLLDKWLSEGDDKAMDEKVYEAAWRKERVNEIFREVVLGSGKKEITE